MQPRPRPDHGYIGHLVVWVLALGLALDVASRFTSYDRVSFRAWEAVQRNAELTKPSTFEPNKEFVGTNSFGDLSFMGNLPELRKIRDDSFSTDAHGFRRTPALGWNGAPVAITYGTSLSAGAGLSNDQTLAAQLAPALGGPVYNAANLRDGTDKGIDELLQMVPLRSNGTLIYEYLERNPLPPLPPPPIGRTARFEQLFGARRVALARSLFMPSPLEVWLRRLRRELENDHVLPNSFSDKVVQAVLENGDPMLFLPEELDLKACSQEERAAAITYWTELQHRLELKKLRLLVVLVPTKWSVYGPLLKTSVSSRINGARCPRLAESLERVGVPAVDLFGPFSSTAKDSLSAHELLYWPDDTHWNPAGVALAAQEISRRLHSLESKPEHPK